jgi:hypothetical protein
VAGAAQKGIGEDRAMPLSLYRLTPLGLFPPGTDATSHQEPCIVAAVTEAAARCYAAWAFAPAFQRAGGKFPLSPWSNAAFVGAAFGEMPDDWTPSEMWIQVAPDGL